MPQYKVTAPNGKVLTLTGDAPPNEAELDQILKQTGTEEKSAVGRFASGAWEYANPVAAVKGIYDAVRHPIDTAKGAYEAQMQRFDKAGASAEEGDYVRAAAHGLTGLLPIIGPAAGNVYDKALQGDYAGATGSLAGIAAGPAAYKYGKPAVVRGLKAAAPVAQNMATRALVRAVAPTGGPNRLRFGNMVAENAPEILRDPELSAWSRAGFQNKLEGAVEARKSAIDAAHDARGNYQSYDTAPIASRIREAESNLTAKANGARNIKPRVVTKSETVKVPDYPGGKVFGHEEVRTTKTPVAVPSGADVVPPLNRPSVNILQEERAALEALGPTAYYESLRRLRDAADKGAQKVYTPSIQADFLNQRDVGRTYAKVAGAYRDELAKIDPTTAQANQAFSRYKDVMDAVQAAEEQELTRPNRGLRAFAGAAGAGIGSSGGLAGAGAGYVAGRGIQAALDAGFTPGIKAGRFLQSGVDKWSAGQAGKILNTGSNFAATMPIWNVAADAYDEEEKRKALLALLEAQSK